MAVDGSTMHGADASAVVVLTYFARNNADTARERHIHIANRPILQVPECTCSISHISVLIGALWNTEQVHSGICEFGQLVKRHRRLWNFRVIGILSLVIRTFYQVKSTTRHPPGWMEWTFISNKFPVNHTRQLHFRLNESIFHPILNESLQTISVAQLHDLYECSHIFLIVPSIILTDTSYLIVQFNSAYTTTLTWPLR